MAVHRIPDELEDKLNKLIPEGNVSSKIGVLINKISGSNKKLQKVTDMPKTRAELKKFVERIVDIKIEDARMN